MSINFTKVSHSTSYQFEHFKEQDKTNLTTNTRGISDYDNCFRSKKNLSSLIKQLTRTQKHPLTILDAGCGSGKVLEQMLNDPRLNHIIDKAIGISKDYFSPIKNVMTSHPKRFTYYKGTVQDVLNKEPLKVDLILDVWGACAYSSDKLALIKQYYQTLKPGGKAFIFDKRRAKIYTRNNELESDLFDMLIQTNPGAFSKNKDSSLVITKVSERLDLSRFVLKSFRETSSIGPSLLSKHKLRAGNALAPTNITYELAPQQSMRLRVKPFTK